MISRASGGFGSPIKGRRGGLRVVNVFHSDLHVFSKLVGVGFVSTSYYVNHAFHSFGSTNNLNGDILFGSYIFGGIIRRHKKSGNQKMTHPQSPPPKPIRLISTRPNDSAHTYRPPHLPTLFELYSHLFPVNE